MRGRLVILLAVLGMASVAAIDLLGVFPRVGQVICVAAMVILIGGVLRGPVQWRPIATRLFLAFVVTLITLPLVDLALRSLIGSSLHYRPEVTFLRKWPLLPKLYSYQPNVMFEGTATGDLAAMTARPEYREPRQVRFQTDARGFRNSPENFGETIDILLLGDSFAAGAGVSQDEMFATLIAKRTGKTVRNLSMSPVGPWGEYVYLLSEIDQLRLSERAMIVWTLYTANDLLDEYGPVGAAIPWATRGDAAAAEVLNLQRRSPIGASVRRWTESLAADREKVIVVSDPASSLPVLFFKPNRLMTGLSQTMIVRHDNYLPFAQVIATMQDLSAYRKLPVLVFMLPAKEEVYGWMYEGKPPWSEPVTRSSFSVATEDLCRIAGLPFYDTLVDLSTAARREYELGRLLWWRDDTHLNPAGHAALAEIIVKKLTSSSQ